MIKSIFVWAAALILLSSCNLTSGLDTPSGDPQILAAARSAFDRGDYVNASKFYQQLSSSSADVQISETAFETLAQLQVFSVSDLVSKLGSGTGGGSTLAGLANLIYSRGQTAGSIRTTIQSLYASTSGISNPQLQGYTRLMISLAMMVQTLSGVVSTSGVLAANDLAANGSACNTAGTSGCANSAACAVGSSLLLTSAAAGDSSTLSMSTASTWSGSPSVQKVYAAASAISAALGAGQMNVSSSSSGIFTTLSTLNTLDPTLADKCYRQTTISLLFFTN